MGSFVNHGGKSTPLKPSQIISNFSSPKFLILHSEDLKLTTVSPFLVSKALSSIAGSIDSVKKLQSGDLLVITSNDSQSRLLLKANKLAHISISVSPHPTLNTSRGVIYCPDIVDLTEEEILDGLKEHKVTVVKQITTKKDETTKKLPLFILTFSVPKLPSKIKAGYLSLNVRPYIPNPLRCFRCQRFGHTTALCRGSATCSKCGSQEHAKEQCDALKEFCINCEGNHEATSKKCTRWQLEKEIQRLKVVNNLSYGDARKQAETILPPRPKDTYASVAKKSSSSIEVQTDISFFKPSTQTPPNPVIGIKENLPPPPPPVNTVSSNNLTTLSAKNTSQFKRNSSSLETVIDNKPAKQLHTVENSENHPKEDNNMEVEESSGKPPKDKPGTRDRSRSKSRSLKNPIIPP